MTDNASTSIDARQWILPSGTTAQGGDGRYYWVLLDPRSTDAYTAWQSQNPVVRTVRVEQRSGVIDTPSQFLLLQNIGTVPALWTLPGFPSVAPKGAATTLADVESMPPPEPSLSDQVQSSAQSVLDTFGAVGRVLLYGTAGLFLFRLYEMTQSSSSSNTESKPRRRTSERPPSSNARSTDRRRSPSGTLISHYR